ncbi:hypothetical protein XENORESO_016044, partial [Xenotaenia resolanae]
AERWAQKRYVTYIPEVLCFPPEFTDRFISLSLLNMSMLPPAAVFRLPWEVNSVKEGESVRTFGRLVSYQPDESRATLAAQHASKEHHVFVQTQFVEPFNPIIGAQYLVLGETENYEGKGPLSDVSWSCYL